MTPSKLKNFLVQMGIGESQAESIMSTSSNYQEVIEQVRDWLHSIDAHVDRKIIKLKNFIKHGKQS